MDIHEYKSVKNVLVDIEKTCFILGQLMKKKRKFLSHIKVRNMQ